VLIVSGGHTQILHTDSNLHARPLLSSVDDAAGECFDKCAKLMGLPYPGGPAIENLAKLSGSRGTETRLKMLQILPRPKTQSGEFSFSGLKTAIRTQLEKHPEWKQNSDFCWAIQEVISEILIAGLGRSILKLQGMPLPKNLVFCGGVSANERIRSQISGWATQKGFLLHLAPLQYCTDNAAMIGAAAWVQDKKFNFDSVFSRRQLD
jgi:N6-L-threonylcarbamoyladenine synthase